MPLLRHVLVAFAFILSIGPSRCPGQRPVRLPSIHDPTVIHDPIVADLEREPIVFDSGGTVETEPSAINDANETDAVSANQTANWWTHRVSQPLGVAAQHLPINLDHIIDISLQSSPHINAVLTQPSIEHREIAIADAEFDTSAFIESRFVDTHDPIGSLLTTGDNSTRYRDETFSSVGGLRKRSRYGGSVEFAQTVGTQANNSTFLLPNPQSTTRLEVNFTQPLMKNRGRLVNQARVSLARLDQNAATFSARQEVETHLIRVAEAYWDLYASRAEYIQRENLVSQARDIVTRLQRRSKVDTAKRQILRAEVDLARREASLVQLRAQVLNAQAKLRALTGDPRLVSASEIELLPADMPTTVPYLMPLSEATSVAIQQRADIAESMQRIRAVSIKVGVAKNQMLPKLDLILSSYIAGLDSRSRGFDAFADQFSRGRPSYAAGLAFEIPIGNRSSRARSQREQLEMNRAVYDFQQTTADAITEVEIAIRNLEATQMKSELTKKSIVAARREVDYLQRRFKMLPDPNESSVVLMEDLLDAQTRLADEERDLVGAEVKLALGHLELRRTLGVLVQLGNGHCSQSIATYNNDPLSYRSEANLNDDVLFEHLPANVMPLNSALDDGMIVDSVIYPETAVHSKMMEQ